ncbi:MAG: 5-histidylcysteine sulfoxide synthase [Candidatus Cloacimonetes bacterium]|nr:5-histidylcysteine sulfoxide synthase [Candidatus Cloacimonadota bacterium]
MELKKTRTIILDKGNVEEKREEIRSYFHKTYDIDEMLYKTLRADSTFYLRADPLRHPLVFYLGHTATFYINKLILAKALTTRINPQFESMFAIGVDEMSWDDLNEAHYNWPTIEEVRQYRNKVREVVDNLISTLPLTFPINWDNPFWVIMMGIEHERIHLETSSVLIRQLPIEEVKEIDFWDICMNTGPAPENILLDVEGGKVALGKSFDHPLYGWDNEYGYTETTLKPFKAAKYLVSNQEFLQFVEENGYHEKKCWTEEGWSWVNYQKSEFPRFWLKKDGKFYLRTMAKIIEMPWNWPVEINYLEAKAFCNWKSVKTGKNLRLPTEEEWNHLRNLAKVEDQPYWEKAPGNINLEHYCSPCPVDEFRFADFYDVVGNVWQWTESPIYGFKGFKVHPCYDDFSTPTFDGRHNLIKGGSWISTGNEATLDSRYAFRRHFYQHAGFRYVESDNPVILHDDHYEDDPEVAVECERLYGEIKPEKGYYPVEIAGFCANLTKNKARMLHLGCSAGRTSFELARYFNFVNGLDFSARFIKNAIRMQEKGNIHYMLKDEGELVTFHERFLSDFGLEETTAKVEFFQTDPANMKEFFKDYDLILADDIIDRIYNPRRFLESIHQRLNDDGILVITSSYDWDENKTAKENWLGGYKEAGDNVSSADGLERLLSTKFEKMPYKQVMKSIIKVSSYKDIIKHLQVTVWKKK